MSESQNDVAILRGMLNVLIRAEIGKSISIVINGEKRQFYKSLKDVATRKMPGTHCFLLKDTERLDLYWFDVFAGIMTSQNLYVEFCSLSDGRVVVGVWLTRCDKPWVGLLIYDPTKKREEEGYCEFYKAEDFRARYPNVAMDPATPFNMKNALE